MAKINVYRTESYDTWILKEPVEIDTDNYPEMEGMTEEEMKDYIRENYHDMKPTSNKWYGSLSEELDGQDVRRDKITNEDQDIMFD
jgi:hypothetical protein